MSAIDQVKSLIKGIVLHWTAGTYSQTFDAYHFNITWDAKKGAQVVQKRSVKSVGAHTWKRNTSRIGIALCSENWTLRPNCPTKNDQLEAMAKLIAELCIELGLNHKGTHKVWDLYRSVQHDVPNVADHVFYAKMDRYGKSDIGKHLPVVMGKVDWYIAKIKSGEMKREYTLNVF